MINTWLIENMYTKEVYGYYSTLYDAKDDLIKICKSRPIEFNSGVLYFLVVTHTPCSEAIILVNPSLNASID